jgi:thioredoxin-related protein
MRCLLLVAVAFVTMSFTTWETDIDAAKREATQQHKHILLSFSGSDWCGPCIRLHKEIFNSPSFTQFAEKDLVLVNADFPRLKKNQLTKSLQHQNDLLADKYNPKGAFPFTLLIDADGKVLKTWDGLPKETPEEFVNEIDAALHAKH